MSLFGSLMNDFDDDPFFGAHLRQMRQMNNMMNSLFSDPFGMMGDMRGPLAIMGSHHPRNALMPCMPQMNMNRLLTGGLEDPFANINGRCNSFSSSTVVMSNGPDGRPQVFSATSSTQVGPGGVKETRRTEQDSRTGTKKMTIGHHIDERAHVIEREQNVRSGDLEERQEFINIEEDDADEFNKEFEDRLRATSAHRNRQLPAITASGHQGSSSSRRESGSRRPLRRLSASPLALPAPRTSSTAANVRHTYGSLHPQRSKQRSSKHHHNNTPDY